MDKCVWLGTPNRKFSVKEFITNSLCNGVDVKGEVDWAVWWKEKFLLRLVIWLKGEDMLHAWTFRSFKYHTLHYAGFSSGMLYP